MEGREGERWRHSWGGVFLLGRLPPLLRPQSSPTGGLPNSFASESRSLGSFRAADLPPAGFIVFPRWRVARLLLVWVSPQVLSEPIHTTDSVRVLYAPSAFCSWTTTALVVSFRCFAMTLQLSLHSAGPRAFGMNTVLSTPARNWKQKKISVSLFNGCFYKTE